MTPKENHMNIADAAAALSMGEDEITSVESSPAGPVITIHDGTRYIVVPDDLPDADGKTGLMWLEAPNPDFTYSFPIFTPSPDDVAELEAASQVEPERFIPTEPGSVAPVKKAGAKPKGRRTKPTASAPVAKKAAAAKKAAPTPDAKPAAAQEDKPHA